MLRPGDYFGESGLLKQTVRTASVRASGDVELLRLDRSVFHALMQSHPELRAELELQDRYHQPQHLLPRPLGLRPAAGRGASGAHRGAGAGRRGAG